MAKQKLVLTDFTSGELSPKMISRTDLESYIHGVKKMTNAYPQPHGSTTSRPGTLFCEEVSNSSRIARLIPYIYSRTLSYVLVLNNGLIRIMENSVYLKHGGVPITINHTYTDTEVKELKYTQVGNTIYIVHKNHPPRIFKRVNSYTFSLEDVPFIYKATTDYFYENYYVKFKIIAGTNAFKVNDDFVVTVNSDGTSTVTSPAPTNAGNGTVVAIAPKNGAPTTVWTLKCIYADSQRQEWTVTAPAYGEMITTWTTGNYPGSIVFHEQRLYFAGTTENPQTIWGSRTGEFNNFTLGALDSDGMQFTIASNQYDEIINLVSGRYMIPMTYGGEFSMAGSSTSGITPSSVRISPQTYHGSNDAIPIKIGTEILFVQRDESKVRAISYSVAEDVNQAPDISILAEHLLKPGIKEGCFSQSPDYISWWVRNDGVLLSCVHMRDNNMTGWASHTTDGLFENCASIPENNYDNVYFIVKRGNKRFIEKFDYSLNIKTDSTVILTSDTAKTVWNGFNNLIGKDVWVISDGIVYPKKPVTEVTLEIPGGFDGGFELPSTYIQSGQLTLDKPLDNITIGIPFVPEIHLQHPVIQNEVGTSQGGVLSVNRIVVKLHETLGLEVNGYDIPFRDFGENLDTASPIYSGDKVVQNLGWSDSEHIVLKQPYPLPWTILSVVSHVVGYD
jgi:hypothetical protein